MVARPRGAIIHVNNSHEKKNFKRLVSCYRLLPRTSDNVSLLRELELRLDEVGVVAYPRNPTALTHEARFHLVSLGDNDILVSGSPQILPVTLIQRTGNPAPTGRYLVDTLLQSGIITPRAYSFSDGRQEMSFVGSGVIQPGDM